MMQDLILKPFQKFTVNRYMQFRNVTCHPFSLFDARGMVFSVAEFLELSTSTGGFLGFLYRWTPKWLLGILERHVYKEMNPECSTASLKGETVEKCKKRKETGHQAN